MSTREREALAAIVPPPSSTSMALVPLRADRGPAAPAPRPAEGPRTVHRCFYGLGYAALALFVLGTFFQPRIGPAAAGLFVPGAMMLGIGGVGVLVHVLHKPSMPKLRKGLGAIAALALTGLAMGPVDRIAQEVHASARIPELQALADGLVRDGRIQAIGRPSPGWVSLNGFHGRLDGSYASSTYSGAAPLLPLYEVLRRDGISRLDLVRTMRRLEMAGLREVRIDGGAVVLVTEAGPDLLYVRPGQPTPVQDGLPGRPLGGGWYLLPGSDWLD